MPTSTQCMECRHYWGAHQCDAYTEGEIPDEIFTGQHDHTEPFEGDGGIRFEPISE